MYCLACCRERTHTSTFCVLCGSTLIQREKSLVEAELTHVTWLLNELASWDGDTLARGSRDRLQKRYVAHRELLLEVLAGVERAPAAPATRTPHEVAVPVVAPPTEPPLEPQAGADPVPLPAATPPEPPPPQEESAFEPAPPPLTGGLEEALAAAAGAPTAEDRVVEEASAWNRLWKPFLTESVGWFIGGFLILAGTLYWVADAWNGMTSLTRALTVFTLASGWSLAFSVWAGFLFRRDTTQAAAKVLERIAAVVAPLATVAVGSVASSPLVFWPVVLVWSGVSTWLALRATRRVDAQTALPLALGMGATTLMMGAAPLLAPFGQAALWVSAVPVVLAAWAFSFGPRAGDKETNFVAGAALLAVALFAVRVHVAVAMLGQPADLTIDAPLLAGLLGCALWLRAPTRAADATSVIVVALQTALLVPAFLAPAPGFVVGALIAAWTSWRLAKAHHSVAAARWLAPSYTFAYAAFQHIDQLVPPVVMALFRQLKESLGYSVAPMPASYDSVYAALFVVVVGLATVVRSRMDGTSTRRAAESAVLFWCTAVASALFSTLALGSLEADPRPALITLPVLATFGLVVGFLREREELTASAACSSVGLAAAYGWWLHSTLPVASVALGLVVLAVGSLKAHRRWLQVGAATLILATTLVAPVTASGVVASGVATLAALLLAEDLDWAWARGVALSVGFVFVARAAALLGLELMGPAVAAAALAAAWASRRAGRWSAWWAPSALAALVAVGLSLLPDSGNARPITFALASAALLVGSLHPARRAAGGVFEALGLTLGALLLFPRLANDVWVVPHLSSSTSAVLTLVAMGALAVVAVRNGRSWQTTLLGVLWLGVTAANLVDGDRALASWAAATVLLATPVLLASLTVPAAALLYGAASGQWLAVAVATSVAGLFERIEFTKKFLLNGSRVAWAASVTALVMLSGLCVMGAPTPWLMVACAALPVLWLAGTRWGPMGFFAMVLPAAAAQRLDEHTALALAPAVAVVLSAALNNRRARAWLHVAERGLGFGLLTGVILAALASSALAVDVHLAWLPVLWAVGLLVVRAPGLALRVAMAGAVLLCSQTYEWFELGAGALVALGFVLQHGGVKAARLLGAREGAFAVASSAITAVVLAAVPCVVHPLPESGAVLCLALVAAAMLLDSTWLAAFAVPALAFNLSRLTIDGLHTPMTFGVAVGAAALALVLRVPAVLDVAEALWERASQHLPKHLATSLWAGAMTVLASSLFVASPEWLVVAALLLCTPRPMELAVAMVVGGAVVLLNLPVGVAAVVLAAFGTAAAWAGTQRKELPLSNVLHHGGWMLVLASLGVSANLHLWAMPVCWTLAAVTAWAVVKRAPEVAVVGWWATWLASHAVLAWAGTALATGAPEALLLPWVGLASVVIALGAERWSHARLSLVFTGIAAAELCGAAGLLDGAYPREAMVALGAMALAVASLVRRAAVKADAAAAVLGQVCVAVGVVAALRLGGAHDWEHLPVWLAVVFGAALSGLARVADAGVQRALRWGALVWPVVGLVAAPWNQPSGLAVVLVAMAAHFAVAAQAQKGRSAASVLSAVAFNGAVLCGYLSSGWDGGVWYLAVPAGLSVLALVKVFDGTLTPRAAATLRAIAMTGIYSATAWRPLAFQTPWALWVCVLVCVLGVGAGIALRIRSYVFLGTGFLVTTVLATLIRSGIQEPRLGAIFLSALGLAVVGFMVLVTTKRAELLARYQAVQRMLSQWDA